MNCPLQPKMVKYEHDPTKGYERIRCVEFIDLPKWGNVEYKTCCGNWFEIPNDWKIGDVFTCPRCKKKHTVTPNKAGEYKGIYFSYCLGPPTTAQEWGECRAEACPLWDKTGLKCGVPNLSRITINLPAPMHIKEGDVHNTTQQTRGGGGVGLLDLLILAGITGII